MNIACRAVIVFSCLSAVAAWSQAARAAPPPQADAAPALRPAAEAWPDVFVFTDTCNTYVLRDGDHAILFNLGDGGVLEHLGAIGVKHVDWILFTDHHREQCQGIGRVGRATTKLAAPKEEQALFETPQAFRKWRPRLGDQYTVHGASYVRPPAAPIKLDRLLTDGEAFEWRGRRIECLAVPGHSPGGMAFVLRDGDKRCAFTGGVMHDGARLTNWYDTEWDYGFAKGLDALVASVDKLAGLNLAHAFPSQGPAIADAAAQFRKFHERLVAFRPDYLRGYPVKNLTERRKVDPIVKPTPIPQIVQVTPHLYKFADSLAGKNFAIIISDSGRGLLLDCGLFPETLLHDLIRDMQTHLGLKQIDALWINHMHGDHFTLGAELKRRFGVKIWTLDRIVDKVENPLRYDYCALITSYNPAYEGLKVDRPLRDGEVVEWEGYQVHVDWMPGQTEFGNCLWLEIDGKRIAFTGDNLFGDPADPTQNGHEAVVARNSAIFEEGYLLGSKYLVDLKPDIIMGAHNVLMTNPTAFVERYHVWAKRIIEHYQLLLPDERYEYGFDPFWVSAYPYRVDLEAGPQDVAITVRNHHDRPQRHAVRLKPPPGLAAEPAVLEGEVPARSRRTFTVKLTADPRRVGDGVQIVPFDITLDGRRYGERFDFLAQARLPAEPAPAAARNPPQAVAPFDAAAARAHQQAWAAHLGTTVETTDALGLRLVLVPPGEFLMGSTPEAIQQALAQATEYRIGADRRYIATEGPQHRVVLTKPFRMSATEITVGQFRRFLQASGYKTETERLGGGNTHKRAGPKPEDYTYDPALSFEAPGYAVTDDSPATQVTWNDAAALCAWLSKRENAKYRLPTEAEWEYACRAGTTTEFSFGDDLAKLADYAWYGNQNDGRSGAVGTKRPNPFGLHDMHGNAREWCADWYGAAWYRQSPADDPQGPATGTDRVLRGGKFQNKPPYLRSAYRFAYWPSYRSQYFGFRVVREQAAE